VMPSAQIISQTLAGRERLGAAASIVSLSRYSGAALGTAIFGAVVFALAPGSSGRIDLHSLTPETATQLSQAIRIGFGALAAVAAIGAWFASRIQQIRL